jgi:light-regulated signal transduction histidine kinase (bacteriophytochrome)
MLTNLSLTMRMLRSPSLYVARDLLHGFFNPKDGESFETIVRRKIPLANENLQRQATAIVFTLMTQADYLKVIETELARVNADVRNIKAFADHKAVRDIARKVALDKETQSKIMSDHISTLQRLIVSMSQRIADSEHRLAKISREIDKHFDD